MTDIEMKKAAFINGIAGMNKSEIIQKNIELMKHFHDTKSYEWTDYDQWEIDTLWEHKKNLGYIKGSVPPKRRIAYNYLLVNTINDFRFSACYLAEDVSSEKIRVAKYEGRDAGHLYDFNKRSMFHNYAFYRVYSNDEINMLIDRELSTERGFTRDNYGCKDRTTRFRTDGKCASCKWFHDDADGKGSYCHYVSEHIDDFISYEAKCSD